jgi:hypothetical protein
VTLDITPDLSGFTRSKLEALAVWLILDTARVHGGLRQACAVYGVPVTTDRDDLYLEVTPQQGRDELAAWLRSHPEATSHGATR